MKLSSALLVMTASVAMMPAVHAASSLNLSHLQCEYLDNPRGIDTTHPRLSWQMQSGIRGQRQTAYRVLVAGSEDALKADRGDLWDSGKVLSGDSTSIEYQGRSLPSGGRCWWKVCVWDKDGKLSEYSPAGSWQMGLLRLSDWKAKWIASPARRDIKVEDSTLPSGSYLRRTFTASKPIRHATLFASARGVYEMHMNGVRIGDAVLAPGWTDYRKRIEYQVYDVTSALRPGNNTIGAILGDGWYSGYIGFGHQRDYFGNRPELLAQLDIEYADGTHQIIASDSTWRTATGPILYSDMLQGESYDARRELSGWDLSGYRAAAWSPVLVPGPQEAQHRLDITAALASMVKNDSLSVKAGNDIAGDPAYNSVKHLRVDYTLGGVPHTQILNEDEMLNIPAAGEQPGKLTIRHAAYGLLEETSGPAAMVGVHAPPVRVTQHITPKSIKELAPDTYLYDLGQNMVGWVRLKVDGAAGTKVRLRFAEILDKDGAIYTTNLRSAKSTDTYICRGGGTETWEPHFTFHGFRYVEVTGYPGKPGIDAITGCVVGSDTPSAGTFECSNSMVNQLQNNIVWGQRGNFLSVPTDCPQRDERLGWMGDAQIFVRTATYNRDVAGFYEKWMQDVEDGQSAAGGFSDVSPRIVDANDGAPAWGDAGIIVPWTVYQAYGDVGIVKKHWAAMNRWMDYITSVNPDGLWMKRRNNDFGDWLNINADTPRDVLATAYYAYDAQLMARMARAARQMDDAAKYDALFAHIKDAFNTAFVTPDGKIKGDTQTCYVLALKMGLLPDGLRSLAAQHLADNIAAKDNHLSTGFVGVGYLCPVLTATGHNDVAYKLLLNDTFPSWGFSIKQGATTIWERWDGWTPDHGFQDPGMNSFNHYSLGSVGQWLYQDVAGIDTDPDLPGYKHILLHPHPGNGLTRAGATYDSIHGTISSAWKVDNGRFAWNVAIPANTTATVWIPAQNAAVVTESGKKIGATTGIKFLREEPGFAVYEVESGTYKFGS